MLSLKGLIPIALGIIMIIFRNYLSVGIVEFQKKALEYEVEEKTVKVACIVIGTFFILSGIIELFNLLPYINTLLKEYVL
jgi:hypothetical protein